MAKRKTKSRFSKNRVKRKTKKKNYKKQKYNLNKRLMKGGASQQQSRRLTLAEREVDAYEKTIKLYFKKDEKTGKINPYWHNIKTGETSWFHPVTIINPHTGEFSFKMFQSLDEKNKWRTAAGNSVHQPLSKSYIVDRHMRKHFFIKLLNENKSIEQAQKQAQEIADNRRMLYDAQQAETQRQAQQAEALRQAQQAEAMRQAQQAEAMRQAQQAETQRQTQQAKRQYEEAKRLWISYILFAREADNKPVLTPRDRLECSAIADILALGRLPPRVPPQQGLTKELHALINNTMKRLSLIQQWGKYLHKHMNFKNNLELLKIANNLSFLKMPPSAFHPLNMEKLNRLYSSVKQ